ncbi:MAG TPA: TonB-dependent receptor [Candidatus Acidoferrales bacterium]|nr:TonB-dependent receptor [Candidatus Acidoferrales bacterium]
MSYKRFLWAFLALIISSSLLMVPVSNAQTGNSANINGTVLDPSKAAVVGATIEIHNPVSGFSRSTLTDSTGSFSFTNVPFNPYHMDITAKGFDVYNQDIEVRSSVPLSLKVELKVAGTSVSVTVESGGGDLVENDPTFHTDVDRDLFKKLPLESQSSSLSSLVTLVTPGVTADSNGLFHGLGDHAENSFSVDGQPITDQQSKIFSNQIPVDAIQSMEVISGAPPANFGDKTSLVIDVTTRSGLGATVPHGDVTASYGSFGTPSGGFNFSYGGANWGNFIAVSGLNSGRFLDGPEFAVLHDKGNEQNVFDRVDYQISKADAVHVNLGYSRSWFQTPNSFDSLNTGVTVPVGSPFAGMAVGPADQRSRIGTYNVAPTWTHIIGANTVFTVGAFARRDQYNYYPSKDPFSDLGPPSLQRETVGQLRFLTNVGGHADLTYVKGIHNIKVGILYEQTFLREHDKLGVVDAAFNAPCLDLTGAAVAGFTDPAQCAGAGLQPNIASNPNAPNSALFPLFNPVLLPFDLTRGGGLFGFNGHTDVKELALYAMDTISVHNWTFNLGIRGDLYNGLAVARQAEPRAGIAYNIKKTNTVLRISYARALETPFNENLVVSSTGCSDPTGVIPALVSCVPSVLAPGFRNEFHAGLEQAFGKYLVVGGEYIWKYTHNGYDFSDLGNTPIFFPIEWHNSKIPGYAIRASVPNFHGLSALVVMSSVAARFFTPQIGGLGTTVTTGGTFLPFRIDHDEHFNMTAHVQYQPWKRGPWFGFNWRYDSGLVAGAVPCSGGNCAQTDTLGGQPAVDMTDAFGNPLTADQEFEAGLFCGAQHATPTVALPFTCLASQFGSTLAKVPAPGTEDDDKNPPRIAPRHLFDAAIGDDNLFHNDKYRWSARFTVINLTNKVALYNFLSTFSGTHYVTPRTMTGEIGFHF